MISKPTATESIKSDIFAVDINEISECQSVAPQSTSQPRRT